VCMCMCVCVCVCVYIYTYVYKRVYTCIYIYYTDHTVYNTTPHDHMWISMCAQMAWCKALNVSLTSRWWKGGMPNDIMYYTTLHDHMSTCVCVCMRMCVCVCIYIHTCTNVYIHVYIYTTQITLCITLLRMTICLPVCVQRWHDVRH
jgi:hypothetical protein